MGTVQRMQVSSAFDNSHWVNSGQGNPGDKGAEIEVKVKCNPEGRETERCLGQCFSKLTVYANYLGNLLKCIRICISRSGVEAEIWHF